MIEFLYPMFSNPVVCGVLAAVAAGIALYRALWNRMGDDE